MNISPGLPPNPMWIDLVALVATCLSLASSTPQIRRTWRTTQIDGVSLAACALGAVTETCWAIYSVERQLWGAVPVAVMMAITNMSLAFMLVRRGARGAGAALLAAGVWACGLTTRAVWAGIDALGPVIGLAYIVQAGPTVWTVIRSGEPSGVSRVRWWLVSAEAVLWGCYGLVQRDPATLIFGVVGLTTAALVLAHTGSLVARRRRAVSVRTHLTWVTRSVSAPTRRSFGGGIDQSCSEAETMSATDSVVSAS